MIDPAVDVAVGSAIPSAVAPAADPAVYSAVTSAAGSTADFEVDSGVDPAALFVVASGVDSAVYSVVDSDVEPLVVAELCSTVSVDVAEPPEEEATISSASEVRSSETEDWESGSVQLESIFPLVDKDSDVDDIDAVDVDDIDAVDVDDIVAVDGKSGSDTFCSGVCDTVAWTDAAAVDNGSNIEIFIADVSGSIGKLIVGSGL